MVQATNSPRSQRKPHRTSQDGELASADTESDAIEESAECAADASPGGRVPGGGFGTLLTRPPLTTVSTPERAWRLYSPATATGAVLPVAGPPAANVTHADLCGVAGDAS